MDFRGLTVAITGSRRASEQAELVSKFGGVPYVAPTVGIEVHEESDQQTEELIRRLVKQEFDYAVFMTGPGVYRLLSTAERLELQAELVTVLNQIFVVARSQKPQKVLERYGIRPNLVPSDNTSEGIAKEMAHFDLRGKRVAVLWYGESQTILRETLERGGSQVFDAMAYTYSLELEQRGAEVLAAVGFKSIPPEDRKILLLIDDLMKGKIHVITFTSPPSARNLFRFAEAHGLDGGLRRSLNEDVVVVAVGPPTRRAVEEHNVGVDVMPDVYKLGPMMRATVDYLAQGPSNARKEVLVRTRSGSAADQEA